MLKTWKIQISLQHWLSAEQVSTYTVPYIVAAIEFPEGSTCGDSATIRFVVESLPSETPPLVLCQAGTYIVPHIVIAIAIEVFEEGRAYVQRLGRNPFQPVFQAIVVESSPPRAEIRAKGICGQFLKGRSHL